MKRCALVSPGRFGGRRRPGALRIFVLPPAALLFFPACAGAPAADPVPPATAAPPATTPSVCDDWGTRAFFRSASPEDVGECLGAGADPNGNPRRFPLAPLFVAARETPHPEVVFLLVGAGAEVDARARGGITPLHEAAAENAHSGVVTGLVEAGADPNARDLNGVAPLHRAARARNPAVFTALVEAGADPNARDLDGVAPIHLAASSGNPAVVTALVEAGADLGVRDRSGVTPMELAWSDAVDFPRPFGDHRPMAVVRELVRLGADGLGSRSLDEITSPTFCGRWHTRDFHNAASAADFARCLEEGADVHARDRWGSTVLHGVGSMDAAVAARLLAAGANPNARRAGGTTPLDIAIRSRDRAIASLLIEVGADVNYAADDEDTPLTTAVRLTRRSAPELILQLLEAGADPNARGEWGRTPLYWAVRRSVSAALVGTLLEAGADPNAPMLNGVTPFEAAAASAKPEVIRLLAAAGADVNRRNPADGSFPLHRAVVGEEPASRVAALLDAGANPRVRNADGDTPLHLAAPAGDSAVISLLAGAGADWKARNDQGETPLDAARRHGDQPAEPGADAGSDGIAGTGDSPCEFSGWHWYRASSESLRDCLAAFAQAGRPFPFQGTELLDLAETLERSSGGDAPEKIALFLAAGADPNGRRGDDPFDLGTPLHIVARGGLRAEVAASALVKAGADVNAREPSGWTPLHVAAAAGGPRGNSIPMVRLLLQAGADVNARTYMGEETPLHKAARSWQVWYKPAGAVHVVAALLEAGAEVDARTSDGRTPLELALKADQAAAAVKLLEAGADPAVRDSAGNPTDPAACGNWGTATFFAVASVDAVADCLEAGADPNSPPTLLHLASVHARDPSVIDILAQAGTDVGARDDSGITPLHRAARAGTPDAVRALLRAGADPHAWEDSQWYSEGTPLHSAASNPNPEVAAVLLEAGADANVRGLDGWTPLHHAAQNPNSAVLAVLLEAGADPTKRGRMGGCFGHSDWSGYLTPLYSAAHGNPETVPMLVAAGADVDGHGTRFRLSCESSLATQVSPIFYAVRYNGHPANIEALARAGADLELAGPDGRTVLHWAAIRSSDVFPLLLRLGADPEARDDEGKTPMDYARENPALQPWERVNEGWTPWW